MTEDRVPEAEISKRLSYLQKKLIKNNMEGIFLTHRPDIYYFSGTAQDCYLYVPAESAPILFIKRYFPRAQKEASIKEMMEILSVTEIPGRIRDKTGTLPTTCGLAFDVVPVRDYHFYQSLFPETLFTDGTAVINSCRKIKSPWEIEQIRLAASLSEKTFGYIKTVIRPGLTEMELCGMFEAFARKHGNGGKLILRHYRSEAYPFHLISGKNGGLPGALDSPVCGTGTSAAFPFGAGHKKINKNEPVLIDIGSVLKGYHMDETRMFAISSMPEEAKKASYAAMEIINSLVSYMKPGILMSDVYHKSVQLAESLGFGTEFLGLPGYKSMFIGHGIGLEVIENPIISKGNHKALETGMVLSLEPKMVFKNKFAAGIESVVYIKEQGAEFLSTTEQSVFIC